MRQSLSVLWWLLRPHLRAQRRWLLASSVMAALATLAGLTGPWLLRQAIDVGLRARVVDRFDTTLVLAGLAYVAAYCLWAAQQLMAAHASERIFMAIKRELMGRLLAQPRAYFDRLTDTEIALRLNTNLRDAALTLRDDLVAGMVEILFVLGLLLALAVLHPPTAGVTAMAVAAYVLAAWLLDKPLRTRALYSREARSAQNALFVDILAGVREVRLFGQQHRVQARFSEVVQAVAASQERQSRLAALARSGFGLLGMLLVLLVVVQAGLRVMQGDPGMTLGLLVALLTLVAPLVATLSHLMARVGRLIEAEPSLLRVRELMQEPPAPQVPPAGSQCIDLPDTPRIDFEGVTYGRPDGPPILYGFSLSVSAGDKVALMGASGSGKSLVLDLLLRMREPTLGRVCYSGIDIRNIPTDLYFSAFGVVTEGGHMARGSLRDYLMQGWPGQTEGDLWRVLESVQMASAVRAAAAGLDTDVGRPGNWTFPTGQRQRLAVARALLRDPQVLVLDNIDAALDPADASVLVADILAAGPGRTVICTTHWPQVAALFDRTVALQAPG